MLTNKWVQAVLCGGIGAGLIVGNIITAISGSETTHLSVAVVGLGFMMIAIYKTANARGTDGWGGPWAGPKE